MPEKATQAINKLYGKKIFFFLPLAIVIIAVIVIAAFIIIGMVRNGGYGGSYGSSYSNAMSDVAYPSAAPVSRSLSMAQDASYSNGSSGSIPAADKKVVKNADVDITVSKVEDAAKEIQKIADGFKGSTDSSNISNGGGDTRYGSITIRVPNESFEAAVAAIEAVGSKVNSERISSDDVTAQYVDLDARLRSKKAVEAQYVALLQKAVKVDEIVSVSSYLNSTREDIERLQAQMNYLSNQVAMSSISVSMTSEAEVQIFGVMWHPITVIKQSFRDLLSSLSGIANWLIWFIFALPSFLIEVAIFLGLLWVVVKIIKLAYRSFKKKTQPIA